MSYHYCLHCDRYFPSDRLITLPSGLNVHHCGHVSEQLPQSVSQVLSRAETYHDRRKLERLYQCV